MRKLTPRQSTLPLISEETPNTSATTQLSSTLGMPVIKLYPTTHL